MDGQMKKEKKKIRKSLALFVLGYLILFLILVGGCVLVGLGYKHFVLYNEFFQFHIKNGTLNEFQDHLNAYNAIAAGNKDIVKASIDMFAPGITMMVVSVSLIIVMLVFHFKPSKEFVQTLK